MTDVDNSPDSTNIFSSVLFPKNTSMPAKLVCAIEFSKIEKSIPFHLLENIEFIFIGWFDEFEERSINSFYKEGTLYISNIQDDEEGMIESIVHEIAHSLETPYGMEIYGDGKIEKEFIGKRKRLFHLLQTAGYRVSLKTFIDTEYDEDFDNFLYKTVGYDKLSQYIAGLMINAYSATSIREYFANGLQEYYLSERPTYLQKISPELYVKLNQLNVDQSLDI